MSERIRPAQEDLMSTTPVEHQTPWGARVLEGLGGPYRSIPILVVLASIWVFFYSQNTAYLSVNNVTNLSLQIVTTAVLALGIVFVLLVGEIDLSSAILSGVCATVAANLAVREGWPLTAAVALAIVVGLTVTFIEAQVVIFGVPSLIVTLGGMVILQGMLLVVLPPEFTVNVAGTDYATIASTRLSDSTAVLVGLVAWAAYCLFLVNRQRHRAVSLGSALTSRSVLVPAIVSGVVGAAVIGVLGQARGLPLPVVILVGLLLVAAYVTTQTTYGAHLYAVGGNREAAQRAGIPVARMVTYSFLVLGACAAIAGVLDASRLLGVSNSSGSGPLMLNAIAAAVVGGVSLFGGRGSVWAALLGALVIGSINNGVQLLGFSPEVQSFATGGVLIAAVAIDVVITRGSLLPGRR